MCSRDLKISVSYDALNADNTFSGGDRISGRVTLEVRKEMKINSFSVRAEGKASVMWTEFYGQIFVVFHDKETCLQLETIFIQKENTDSDVIPPGCHVYPFTFQLPQQEMPSSFKTCTGKVVYFIEAEVKRPMRLDAKEKVEFTYLSRTNMDFLAMKKAQIGNADKSFKFLNSGSVSVTARIDSTNYYFGDEMKITADIQNLSSRPVKPKYRLYQRKSFFAMRRRRVCTKDIANGEAEPVQPSERQTVTWSLTIPSDVTPTSLNCRVLRVEYILKVYLDVKYSRDPDVQFPLVIFAAPQIPDEESATFGDVKRMDEPPPYSVYAEMGNIPNAAIYNPKF
ncbi:arrestin domain-containing protein 3-like [Engraulis encrasicolus]|uniref:arrestin domain-containing protein 3-like n=1 Tax=Engraulis encrasicolus TaxID=184585 RepID=UPI002FD2A9DA